MSFQDHFSSQAGDYARFRPEYPPALFDSVVALLAPEQRRLAWDCATGNGQAARALARHFAQVIGSDASAEQIQNAKAAARVSYRVFTAEAPELDDNSVDLVTVAQALHWFDIKRFYQAVRRVSRPHSCIAVWGYGLNSIDAAVDGVVRKYYHDVVGPYWPEDRRHIESAYQSLPFPFQELDLPQPRIAQGMNLEEFLGYLGTWSATVRYRAAQGFDPREQIQAELAAAWGNDGGERPVVWNIFLRAGRIHGASAINR